MPSGLGTLPLRKKMTSSPAEALPAWTGMAIDNVEAEGAQGFEDPGGWDEVRKVVQRNAIDGDGAVLGQGAQVGGEGGGEQFTLPPFAGAETEGTEYSGGFFAC